MKTVMALAGKYSSESNERVIFVWNLSQVIPEQEVRNFHSEQRLEAELTRRGFLRGGGIHDF